ncbi:DUF58 domain-containing protein [Cytobacillus sp. FJAT-54145]|uniref:DUF58 domain-containing protein n=1 Tax=Cytobacillus spartinae TaxID=3299023 RepID=A0ABW6KH76_9BACI
MEWKKHIVEDRGFTVTSLIAFLLLLVGFFTTVWFVFLIAVLYFVLFYANNLYLKNVGEGLKLNNKKIINRYFIGERGEWQLIFENSGLPIMRGEVRIVFDDCLAPIKGDVDNVLANYELTMPFSINRGNKREIQIPYEAKKRGVSKIRKIEITLPHFFGFGETILEYKHFVKQEVLVYPKTIPIKNIQHFLSKQNGESVVNHSLFEDLLAPSGTRDYLFSDSFNRIHWKASARKQTLQTKVYNRLAERGYHLSLNISDGYSITSQLEPLLSSAAELAYFSIKNDIPFSLSINMRVAGSTPFYYIPQGTGNKHLQKVLETLAVIGQHSYIYPYDKMLSFYNRHLSVQPYFIHGGVKSGSFTDQIIPIRKKGTSLLQIELFDQYANLQPLHIKASEGVS